jgi:sulfatase modifying factor 1
MKNTPNANKGRIRRKWAGVCGVLVGSVVTVPACSDDPGSGSPTGSCPTERFVTEGDTDCDTGRGGPMRRIPVSGGGSMCIDKTEVTVGQYQQFLEAEDKPSLPPSDPAAARCAKKTTHAATCFKEPCRGVACDMPQPCVDQCDAKVFCAWAGKRLCGAMGPDPLGIDRANLLDPAKNQWRNACSPHGLGWPYGADYDGQACNSSFA